MSIANQNYYLSPCIKLAAIQRQQYFSVIPSCLLIYLPQYTIKTFPMTSNSRSPKQLENYPVNKKQIRRKLKGTIETTKFSRHRNNRYNQHVQSQPRTIEYTEGSQYPDNKIIFSVNQTPVSNGIPGVGQYDIASPIVKPTYQTFEKNNNVILVKLNHIGGTNSFCSEAERFADGQNYITPGPGAYYPMKAKAQSCSKQTYSENYALIQQAFRNNRQTRESIPSYKIGQQRMKYNGIPRHLQEMYLQLSKPKETIKMPALPLDKLVQLRKKAQKKLIKVGRSSEVDLGNFNNGDNPIKTRKHWGDRQDDSKLTQTIYRLQRQSKRQEEIAKKIKAILEGDKQKRKSSSLGGELIQSNKRKNGVVDRYNQSMVNMIFQQKKGHRKHVPQQQ